MFADFPLRKPSEPHYQRSFLSYTTKPNLNNHRLQGIWLVTPEKNPDSADGTGPAFSRDA